MTSNNYIGDEMAQCDYCGKDIIFGGVREYDLRFCNKKCRENGDAFLFIPNEYQNAPLEFELFFV